MSNAHASVPEVTKPTPSPGSSGASTAINNSSMSHHLDLVRSGVASIEEELQQRASILAVDNANLRTIMEQSNGELQLLRSKMNEYETMQKKLVKLQQQLLANEKENKSLKQTCKYLQQELVKSGKKMPLDGSGSFVGSGNTTAESGSSASGGLSAVLAKSPKNAPPWHMAKTKFSFKKKGNKWFLWYKY